MITVHKFGGASVRDAASVKNAASIIKSLPGEHLVIVAKPPMLLKRWWNRI
jgi:aspartokinase